jgi:hypothetical protein
LADTRNPARISSGLSLIRFLLCDLHQYGHILPSNHGFKRIAYPLATNLSQ